MKILSTLSKVVSVAPKPPLSLLRLGAMATPMGAGIVGASVVASVAFANKDKIGSTLGNLASSAKKEVSQVISTTEKITGITPSKNPPSKNPPSTNDSSMIFPLLAIGGLVIVFFAMRK